MFSISQTPVLLTFISPYFVPLPNIQLLYEVKIIPRPKIIQLQILRIQFLCLRDFSLLLKRSIPIQEIARYWQELFFISMTYNKKFTHDKVVAVVPGDLSAQFSKKNKFIYILS